MEAASIEEIIEQIKKATESDNKGMILSWSRQQAISKALGVSCRTVEQIALENDILPARYQRNRMTISIAQQLQLFYATVAVVGCGGLGGYVIEELARLGVGRIVVIDSDVFEEHNLNRQLLATVETLGQAKVEAAASRVSLINPCVEVIKVREHLSENNGKQCLRDAIVAVDALDTISSRMALSNVCREVEIPLVHGAIAGWYGHVCVQMPGEQTVESLYRHAGETGVETTWGNPAFTPAVVASLEAVEVCKILLNEGIGLRNKVLTVNLLEMEIECVDLN